MFFQKKCLFSIPIRTLCGLCVLQSLWAFYLGILAETPNPFPRERGYITGATAPRPCRGLRPCDPIYIIKRFIDSLKDVTLSVTSLSYIRLFGVFACRRKCDGTFDTLFLKLAGQLVGLLYIALIDKAVCVTAA